MKLLDTLSNFEHTFTNWAAKEYQAFRKEEPTLIALSDRVFPYAKSALEIGLSFESPAVALAAGPILDKIHSNFDTAAGLIYDFGANPTVASVLTTAQANLGSFEDVAGIKSPEAIAAVGKAMSSVQALSASVFGAIAAARPVASVHPSPPAVQQ
jgi:hypothetical protein